MVLRGAFGAALIGALFVVSAVAAPADVPEPTAAAAPSAAPAAWEPITSDTWGARVGFAPDLDGAPPAGTKVSAANEKEFKKWIPSGVDLLVSKYKLVLEVVDYEAVHPSSGYIEATNKYAGQPQLIEGQDDPRKLAMKDYTAGLPFPQPKSGKEVAYDYALSYRGDDGSYHYGVFWISAASGVERWEEWRWEYVHRVKFRTDLEPLDDLPDFAEKGTVHLSRTWAIAPQDKRGFAALHRGSEEPDDLQIWIYLPPTRRTLRMAAGTRGDAWNSTDLLYEDVGGYAGHPEWMEWKIIAKTTVLAPVHAALPHGKGALQKVFDFKTWPHWNLRARWEPRPVYVVEAKPRLADYPYSRMILYFDAETFHIPVKVAYDRKGELWKVLINASNASPDMDEMPLQIGTALVVDLQSEHATAFPAYGYEANVGHDLNKFTLTSLRKMGR